MATNGSRPRISLYVGDLHPKVTEDDLVETFGRVGPLLSVHICREKQSLCYAYVNFWFHCHASTALKSLNHTTLRGKPMRITWSLRDSITRKNRIGNLFVKNLHDSITSSRLQEVFSQYGTILSCNVVQRKGVSRGFGFVQFDSDESAIAACCALHNSLLNGKKLYVCKVDKLIERRDSERSPCVKNLDEGITVDVLKNDSKSHGGFVDLDSREAAQKAMEVLNGEIIGSKRIVVGRDQKKAEKTKQFRAMYNQSSDLKVSILLVKNLDASVDDKRLEELFSSYGKVTSAKVIRNRDGVSRECGFVCFSCPQESYTAFYSLIGAKFEGKTPYLAFARPKPQQTRNFEKSNAKFQTQLIYDSNSTWQPRQWCPLYQKTARLFRSSYPFQAQDFQGVLCAFIPLRQLRLWNTRDCVKQHSPVHRGTWDVYIPGKFAEIPKGQVPYNISANEAINGSVQTCLMRSSPEIGKIWPRQVYLQPVYAAATGNGV